MEVPAIPNDNGTGGPNSKLKGGRGSDRYVYFSELLNYLENINPSSYATVAQLNAGLALKLDLIGTSINPMTGGIQYSPSSDNTTFLYSTSKSFYAGVSDNSNISIAANKGYIHFNKASYSLELGSQNPSNFSKLQILSTGITAFGDNSFSGILYNSSINYSNFTLYTLVNKQYTDNNYVSISNNTTMTGFVTLAGDPTVTYGAATKNYVDNLSYNTNWKHSVIASTTNPLPPYTVSLDFQTLTGTTNNPLTAQDTITINVGDDLLVKNETSSNKTNHGAFKLTQQGSLLAGIPYILTRRADSNTSTLLYGATYTILLGSQSNQRYAVNVDPIILGTTQITFALIGGPGAYINGTYLSLTGNVFDINFSSFSTTQITEGANLYFTNARAISALTGQSNSIFTNGAGYITGNQTITLSGDISGSGTTSIVTSIGSNKITNTMLAGSISFSKLIATDITTIGTITTGGLGTGSVIGGVTMTLGSDASYDIYYRNSTGILTRLANGTTGQVLTATTSSAPAWSTVNGSPFSDGAALIKNSIDSTKLAIFSLLSLSTGTTRTYTLPDVTTTLKGFTGTPAANNVLYFNSTNEFTNSNNLAWTGSNLQIGGSAPINGAAGINITANSNNRAFSIGGTSQTVQRIMSFDNNTGSDNSFLALNGTSVVGNIGGTSIAFAKLFEILNGGAARINPISLEASRIYGLIGNTSTNVSNVQDAVGFRIGLMSDVHTTNLNAFTVEGKTYLGANSTATYTLDVGGDLGIPTANKTLRLSTSRLSTVVLVAGVATISLTGLTTSSYAIVQLITAGGTLGTHYKAVCTAGTLTITSIGTIGTTTTTDTSTVSYIIFENY